VVGFTVAQGDLYSREGILDPVFAIRAGLETDGITLTKVVAGGPAWTMGLRPGWTVDNSSPSDDLPGAVAACGAPLKCYLYHDLQPLSDIATRWRFEILAAIFVLVAVRTWRRRPRLAGLLALAAIAASAPTYAMLGQVPLFPVLYVASLVAPPTWLHRTSTNPRWTIILLGALAVATAWVIAWLVASQYYDHAEGARVMVIIWAAIVGVAAGSGWFARVEAPTGRWRSVDSMVALAVGAAAAVAWWVGVIPDGVVAIVASIALIAYFAFRHRLRSHLARVSFAELGHRSTLRALEAERSRVARDLHDVPLQELSAVIHRLDELPEAAPEAARLRQIAGHLRDVTVSLRPPVLDDLGLGAAVAELPEPRFDDKSPSVRVSLDDRTGIDADSRPPADVELAVFRIVHEALANAQRHAGASIIQIEGVISRNHLRLTIADDGRGFDPRAAALTQRAGRLGLASMRERASAIGAKLTVSPAPVGSGTWITVEWNQQ
jgi:signal transduction histidine kinase